MYSTRINKKLTEISEIRNSKEDFLYCIRIFAKMNEVYAVEGTGLNRTQSAVTHYKFIGEIDMPESFGKIKVNTRKGVEVEYLRTTKTA